MVAAADLAPALIADAGACARTRRSRMVVKALGNGFFDAANKGAQEAAKELGDVEIIYTGPTDTDGRRPDRGDQLADRPEGRRHRHLGQRRRRAGAGVKKAMERGIKVISFDSGVAPEGRMMHLNPSSNPLIGNSACKMAADNLPEGGEVAILSATATSRTRTPGSRR